MKKIFLALFLFIFFGITSSFASSGTMVGSDADEHGCIGSAGYVWNATSQKCERPWEVTSSETMVGNDKDEHGCIASAGYVWNTTSQACERPWEVTTQKVYTTSADFLKAEGLTCKRATDGCNSVSILNGQLGAMTQMYCENIYGSGAQEQWSCLDQKLEDETLGFMSENDRNYYKTLQSQIDSKAQDRISGVLDSYGDKVLEKYSWNVPKSVKLMEKTIVAFETAIHNLSMKTPADAAMSETDTKKYQILNYAKFELQIMMHRWMRNAGIN